MPKIKPKDKSDKVFIADTIHYDKDAKEKIGKKLSEFSFDPNAVTLGIMEFGKFLTNVPLYDYQEESIYRIIYSIITLEGANITLLFARQSGKTEAIAFVIVSLSVLLPLLAKLIPELEQYKDGIKIGIFAPQQDQVNTTYSRCMLRISSTEADMLLSDPEINTKLTSDVRFQLDNGSFVKGQVAAKQSKIESKTYDLIICEEAQDLDSFIVQKSIEPMGTSTNATIVKVGTTGTTKNHFWYDILENKRMSRNLADKRIAYHFEYDYKYVINSKRLKYENDKKLFHLNYEQFVNARKNRWGEHSDAFRLAYALVWGLDSGMFITDKDWESMCNRKKGLQDGPDKGDFIVAGLDIAKSACSTVLTVAKVVDNPHDEYAPSIKEIVHWLEIQGEDYETQHHMIIDTLMEWDVSVLAADYTGVGKAVVDRIMTAVGDNLLVIPYTFSRPSKSDMWQALTEDIRNKRFRIPANRFVRDTQEFKNCEQQLKAMEKWYEGSYIVAQKAENEKDDYVDSMGLACIAGNYNLPDMDQEVEDTDDNDLLGNYVQPNQFSRNCSW